MKHSIVIHHPEQLTKNWAQSILSHHQADAKVWEVNLRSMNIGTTTRLKIQVEHDATGVLPAAWFVKTPSLRLKSRLITALPRLLHKEVNFYKSFAHATPLKLPPILAAQSQFGLGSTLVMTDLTELGFRPGQTADELTFLEARQVVEHLAQFHGFFWGNQNLLKAHDWLGGFNARAEELLGSVLAVPLMKLGLHHAGPNIPDKLIQPALDYAASRSRNIKFLASDVLTLVHHDCHPGNLFWTDSGPGFLDWQLVRMGEGIGDIAYFLATALAPEVRRRHELALLEIYLTGLEKQGIPGLDENHFYQRYRAHLTYPFEAMVVTLAIGGMMETAANLELIKRAVAAVEDHDSFQALLG